MKKNINKMEKEAERKINNEIVDIEQRISNSKRWVYILTILLVLAACVIGLVIYMLFGRN